MDGIVNWVKPNRSDPQTQEWNKMETSGKGKKGFVFTIDSMFALAAISLLAIAYVTISNSHFEVSKYSSLESQARDYLRLNYREGVVLTPNFVKNLTGHNLTHLGNRTITFDSTSEEFLPIWGKSWSISQRQLLNILLQDGVNIEYAPDLKGTDYYSEVQIYLGNVPNNNELVGLGARVNASGAGYFCTIDANNKLVLRAAREWQQDLSLSNPGEMASANINPIGANSWFTLWLNMSGSSIMCGIQNNAYVLATDYNFSYGSPALRIATVSFGFGVRVYFDNFSIYYPQTNASNLFRSVLYSYPAPCNLEFNGSLVRATAIPCMRGPENFTYLRKEVWVS